MEVFKNYSKYYDLLYQDKDYCGECDYVASLIEKYSKNKSKNILELGCGTGRHASILNEKGFKVFGIDMSETMLQRAKKHNVDCEVADVRTYRANKKFDGVISLFHILSYQTNDNDVLNFFKTASIHLDKDGVFVFDLWYKPAVLAQLPQKRIKKLEDDEIAIERFCSPNHLIDKSVVEVNYDIRITDKKTSRVEKISETHPMRYFSTEEIINFAKSEGIEIVHFEEWLSGKIPDETTWGVCFVGVKK